MSLVAPTPSELSAPALPKVRGRLLNNVDKDWSYADWAIAVASVSLAVCSTAFFSWSYVISIESPDYFQKAALARMAPKVDQIETGSVEMLKDAMPAPSIVRDRVPVPSDYQIVMIYRDEALLATQDELMRVKVGSVVPGLGTVKAIDGTALGGSIAADQATLRSAALPGS